VLDDEVADMPNRTVGTWTIAAKEPGSAEGDGVSWPSDLLTVDGIDDDVVIRIGYRGATLTSV
jgi:hypothetical protein